MLLAARWGTTVDEASFLAALEDAVVAGRPRLVAETSPLRPDITTRSGAAGPGPGADDRFGAGDRSASGGTRSERSAPTALAAWCASVRADGELRVSLDREALTEQLAPDGRGEDDRAGGRGVQGRRRARRGSSLRVPAPSWRRPGRRGPSSLRRLQPDGTRWPGSRSTTAAGRSDDARGQGARHPPPADDLHDGHGRLLGEPDLERPPARRLPGRHDHQAGPGVLVQRGGRPADGRARLPRGPDDLRRRARSPRSAAASARRRRPFSTQPSRPGSRSRAGRTTPSTSATTRWAATRRCPGAGRTSCSRTT